MKYMLVSFFFLLASYFVFCLITNYSPDKFLPPEPQAVISVNKPKKILYEYQFLLDDYPELKKLKKFLPLMPNLNTTVVEMASGPVLIIDFGYLRGLLSLAFLFKDTFLQPGENFYLEENPMLLKIDEDAYMIKRGKESFGYLARKRNILIVSPFLKPFRTALANAKTEHKLIDFDRSGDISIQFRAARFLRKMIKLYPQVAFIKDIIKRNRWGLAQVNFKEKWIEATLKLKFSEPKSYQEKIIAKFLSMDAGERESSHVVPLRTGSYVSFSTEAFEKIYNYLVVLFKDKPEFFDKIKLGSKALKFMTDKSIQSVLFSWMGQEITAVTLSDYQQTLLLVAVESWAQFKRSFEPFIGKKAFKVGNSSVYRMELPGIFQFLKDLFAPSIKLPYFTVYQNKYLLIGNSPREIQNFIKKSTITLKQNKSFKALEENTPNDSHLIFYADLSHGFLPFMNFDPLLKKLLQRYYKVGGSAKFNYPDLDFKLYIFKD